MTPPIRLESVSKRFRSGFLIREIRALESVTLEVNEGEIFGFLGPNGAGKTTAIKILMGLTKPTSGTCSVLGEPPRSAAAKRRIGFLPESPYFYEHLTAREVLELSADLSGVPRSARKRRVDRMLDLVNMTAARDSRLGKFSRGMLQRVGIAQALIHDPEVVILDEPMGGLDPIGRKEFRDLIVGLRNQHKTVFFSTHILQDVEMVCDRVGILVAGRLVSLGRLDEILSAEIESVELTVSGVGLDVVQSSGAQIQQLLPGEGKLMIVVRTPADAELILKTTLERKGTVVSVVPRTRTLEEFFMAQVTREDRARRAAE